MRLTNIFPAALFVIMFYTWSSCSDASQLNENNPPLAVFSISPGNGDTSTTFTFDASMSSDSEDFQGALLFTWDFEGNHDWTDPVNEPITTHRYLKSGTYNICLKVIDTEGWSGESRKSIIVVDSI